MSNRKKRIISILRRAFFLLLTAMAFTFLAGSSFARTMTEYPRVKLQSIDKATARTMTFEGNIGSTLKFGTLYVQAKSCQKSSPVDEPESAAFLQIWENDTEGKPQWVFSGWMFASSPGLSAMEHPIYDVWVVECLDDPNNPVVQTIVPAAPEDSTETEGEDTLQ